MTTTDNPVAENGEGPGVKAQPNATNSTDSHTTPEAFPEPVESATSVPALIALLKTASGEGLEPNLRRQVRWLGIHGGDWIEIQSIAPKVWDPDHDDEHPCCRYAHTKSISRVVELARSAHELFQFQGLYLVVNRFDPATTARDKTEDWRRYQYSPDPSDPKRKVSNATKDDHILSRRVVALDFDAARPDSSQPATKEERDAAIRRAIEAMEVLSGIVAWDNLALVMSGNGAQVWIRLADLPSTTALTARVKDFLLCCSAIWSDAAVHVDTSVHDPKRILPLAGTQKRKGVSDPETGRVWRNVLFVACALDPVGLDGAGFDALCRAAAGRADPEKVRALQQQIAQRHTSRSVRHDRDERDDPDNPWTAARNVLMADVMRAFGADPEKPVCPGCGHEGGVRDTSTKIVGNVLKCLHETCGQSVWTTIDWVAMTTAGVDCRGDRDLDAAKRAVDCIAERFTTPKLGEKRKTILAEAELEDGFGTGIVVDTFDPDQDDEAGIGTSTADTRYGGLGNTGHPRTDLGNAERLVDNHGADLRFVPSWGKWLVWDGTRWSVDVLMQVMLRSQRTVRSIYGEAALLPNRQARTAMAAWAVASESKNRISAMVSLAEPMLALAEDMLDREPWLLACRNGVVDLRTGIIRPHARNDYSTKAILVDYDPDAACTTWDSFLARVQPDPEMRAYLARRVGYGCTGVIREHTLTIDWGTGSNGKTTFAEAVEAVLGDYAVVIPSQMLMAKKSDSHPTELTLLHGARYASCCETDQGRALSVALVKQLTGGDRITARRMREDFWTFLPTHKLNLATNHRPRIKETGNSIWRRVHLVPWTVTIPDAEQDHMLLDKLKAESAGILAWIVRGCLEWQRVGLRPPAAVVAATKDYRDAEDTVGQFLAECIEREEGARTERSTLRASFDAWCEERGDDRTLSARNFTEQLRERGIQDAKPWKAAGKTCRGWADVRLVNRASPKVPSGAEMADLQVALDAAAASGLQVAAVSPRSGSTPEMTSHETSYENRCNHPQPATEWDDYGPNALDYV